VLPGQEDQRPYSLPGVGPSTPRVAADGVSTSVLAFVPGAFTSPLDRISRQL
jgi:hypothetical protein